MNEIALKNCVNINRRAFRSLTKTIKLLVYYQLPTFYFLPVKTKS